MNKREKIHNLMSSDICLTLRLKNCVSREWELSPLRYLAWLLRQPVTHLNAKTAYLRYNCCLELCFNQCYHVLYNKSGGREVSQWSISQSFVVTAHSPKGCLNILLPCLFPFLLDCVCILHNLHVLSFPAAFSRVPPCLLQCLTISTLT